LKELSFKTVNGGELLAVLHQIACNAQLCVAKQLLKRAMRLVPSTNLAIVRSKSSSPLILDGFAVQYPDLQVLRLRIDVWTGRFGLAFRSVMSSNFVLWYSAAPDVEMYPTAEQVTPVLLLALWNVLTSAVTIGMYGTSTIGMTVTLDLYHIRLLRTYAFAPDFAVLLRTSFWRPTVVDC
jgi:hypothetical protein